MFSATHIGREHLRLGRNNQDGHFASAAVIVVTDGCGSQSGSEVGAQLGARFLGEWLSAQPPSAIDAHTPERAISALCDFLAATARALGGDWRDNLERFFLFTVLAAVRFDERALVFGLGDGAVLVDERLTRLESGPDNAPYYCAYRLTAAEGSRQPVQVHHLGPAGRVAVMSDGLDKLDPVRLRALVELDVLKNRLTLQRRLNVLAETERFTDDATLAVLC